LDANAVSAKGAKSTDNDDAIIPEEKARKRWGKGGKQEDTSSIAYIFVVKR